MVSSDSSLDLTFPGNRKYQVQISPLAVRLMSPFLFTLYLSHLVYQYCMHRLFPL